LKTGCRKATIHRNVNLENFVGYNYTKFFTQFLSTCLTALHFKIYPLLVVITLINLPFKIFIAVWNVSRRLLTQYSWDLMWYYTVRFHLQVETNMKLHTIQAQWLSKWQLEYLEFGLKCKKLFNFVDGKKFVLKKESKYSNFPLIFGPFFVKLSYRLTLVNSLYCWRDIFSTILPKYDPYQILKYDFTNVFHWI